MFKLLLAGGIINLNKSEGINNPGDNEVMMKSEAGVNRRRIHIQG